MANKIQVRRGATALRQALILDAGEPGWDNQLKRLFVGDGITPGGIDISPPTVGFKNKLINGAFDYWQRNTSGTGTVAGYVAVDRFLNNPSISSCTMSRQPLPAGSFGSGIYTPRYFTRMAVTSATTAACYVTLQGRNEGLAQYSGRTYTLSVRLRAGTAGLKAVPEITLSFGAGGSSNVTTIGVTTWTLTTGWVLYSTTFTIPDLSGYTFGTAGTDSLNFNIWLDGGANSASRNNNIGYQSGTFDFACLQLEPNNFATDFEVRPPGIEFPLCQRYYEKSYDVDVVPVDFDSSVLTQIGGCFSSTAARFTVPFKVAKRITPTIGFLAPSVTTAAGRWALYNSSSVWAPADSTVATNVRTHGFNASLNYSSGGLAYGQGVLVAGGWTADSEL